MYKINKQTITLEKEQVTVFGIESEEISVNNISTDYDSLERLVMQLNKGDVSIDHIFDIIEDFIIDY
jgi:hypothetical protein